MCPDEGNLDEFLDTTVDEVYDKLNLFIEELGFVVEQDLKKLFEDAEISCPSREMCTVQRDLVYLTKMKRMDRDLRFVLFLAFVLFFFFFFFFFNQWEQGQEDERGADGREVEAYRCCSCCGVGDGTFSYLRV